MCLLKSEMYYLIGPFLNEFRTFLDWFVGYVPTASAAYLVVLTDELFVAVYDGTYN
jgi:hypothetical protein